MSIQERKERQKEQIRSSILQAARAIAEKEGWEAVSLRKIADIIEYSAPLIYSYFASKEAILMAFVNEGYNIQYQVMKKAMEGQEDPALQLRDMAVACWQFAVKKQLYYQLMYGVKVVPCTMCQDVYAGRRQLRELVLSVFRELIRRSPNPDTDPELKYLAFWALVHGVASLYIGRTARRRQEEYRLVLEDGVAGIVRTLEA